MNCNSSHLELCVCLASFPAKHETLNTNPASNFPVYALSDTWIRPPLSPLLMTQKVIPAHLKLQGSMHSHAPSPTLQSKQITQSPQDWVCFSVSGQ